MTYLTRSVSSGNSDDLSETPASALRARLRRVVEQEPLFETSPSRDAVHDATSLTHTDTVFAGVGLVSGPSVTRTMPLDVMGLLLSAEQIRRTLAAPRLIVLVADSHGLSNGASPSLLQRSTELYVRRLQSVARRCHFSHMEVVRGSDWNRDPAYQATLRAVRERMPSTVDPYVVREVADIAHVERTSGGVLKVGWALQRSARGAVRDERLFDDAFTRWIGGRVCFAYAKPGRALDDLRPKVSPYVVANADRRICIDPREDVIDKLERAQHEVSRSTYRGVCKHLRAITRSYGQLVRPLRGTVPERAQTMINDLLDADDRPRQATHAHR